MLSSPKNPNCRTGMGIGSTCSMALLHEKEIFCLFILLFSINFTHHFNWINSKTINPTNSLLQAAYGDVWSWGRYKSGSLVSGILCQELSGLLERNIPNPRSDQSIFYIETFKIIDFGKKPYIFAVVTGRTPQGAAQVWNAERWVSWCNQCTHGLLGQKEFLGLGRDFLQQPMSFSGHGVEAGDRWGFGASPWG